MAPFFRRSQRNGRTSREPEPLVRKEEAMSWREFWLIRGKDKKFWKIQLSGKSYTVAAGPAGTQGQTTTKEFASHEEAEAAYLAAMSKAAGQGYREGDEQTADLRKAWADWDV